MKIQPVASPHAVQQTQANPQVQAAAKAKAVAMLQGQSSQPQQTLQQQLLVPDANNISPEDAVVFQKQEEVEEVTEEIQQVEEKPKEDPRISRQLAQLARRERELRSKSVQQDQALKAREAALLQREQELTQRNTQYSTDKYVSMDDLKSDPFKYVDYNELTEKALNPAPRDPRLDSHIARLEAKIAQLEQSDKEVKQSYERQQQDAYHAAVKQITTDAKTLVQSDPVSYEAISKTGSVKDIVELITETYNKDGILMTVEEAAQEVENYLVDQGVNTLGRIDKIKRKLGLAQAQPKEQTRQVQKQTQPMKTLTNATSSTRPLSARERALLAFKGQLKT